MNVLKFPLFWEAGGWFAFLVVGGLCIWIDFKRQSARRNQPGMFLAFLALLCFKRILILFINRELNPDESQLLSQAITLRHHPVYWKYVDGATMGPLSSYYAALPGYLGIPLQYMVLRWTGFFCLLTSMVSGYFTAENFFNARVARLALFPAIAFLAFTTDLDFLHATNEQLSLALIGLALWQYSRLWRRQAFTNVRALFVLGFVSSLVPFAKLQGTPTVLIVVVAAFIGLLSQYANVSRPAFWRALGGLLAGGLFFPVLVVVLAIAFGVFNDFIQFYIIGNFGYGAEASFWYFLSRFPAFVGRTGDFVTFLIPTFVILIGWLLLRSRVRKGNDNLLVYILALLIVSSYAVIKPGNEFTHYLLYLVIPVCLLNAWLIARFQAPLFSVFWVGVVILSVSIQAMVVAGRGTPALLYSFTENPFSLRQSYKSPTALAVLDLAKPGSDLVVWGWAPQYNVQTQMPQGVSDNHTIRCVMGSNQKVHRDRYMRNIRSSRPPVFIDAVGPNSSWLNDRARYGYEQFPELKEFIDQHYRLAKEIDSNRVFALVNPVKQ